MNSLQLKWGIHFDLTNKREKVEEIDSSAWIFTEYSYPAMVADGNNIYITYTYKRDKIKYVFVSFNEEA